MSGCIIDNDPGVEIFEYDPSEQGVWYLPDGTTAKPGWYYQIRYEGFPPELVGKCAYKSEIIAFEAGVDALSEWQCIDKIVQ